MTTQENEEAKNKDVHFLILRPSEEKIDFEGLNYETKNKIKPEIAFKKRVEKEDGTYLEQIVFKFKKKSKKKDGETKSTKYAIKFFEGDHTYSITFSLRDECFVYMPDLKTGNKFLDNILEEPIKQNIVPLYNKLDIFLEALQKDKEMEKKEIKLYEDSIDLYEKKKTIQLFDNYILENLPKEQRPMQKINRNLL